MNNRIRRFIGCVALALSCIMIGSAMTLATDSTASAEKSVTKACANSTHANECKLDDLSASHSDFFASSVFSMLLDILKSKLGYKIENC